MGMILREFLEEIEWSDLNEGLQLLAEKTDIDTVKELMLHHPEERIYFKPVQSCRHALKRYVGKLMTQQQQLDVKKIAYELGVKKSLIQTLKRELDRELLGN